MVNCGFWLLTFWDAEVVVRERGGIVGIFVGIDGVEFLG